MAKRTGLIFAYDFSDFNPERRNLLQEIAEHIDCVKVGLEAMTLELPEHGNRTLASVVREFTFDVLDKDVMWDMKIHDVANTMGKAARNIITMGPGLFTLHAQASDEALEAVATVARQSTATPLAVTVLTDLDDAQCKTRFLPNNQLYAGDYTKVLVANFASNAVEKGITGFVCSGLEAPIIREVYAGARIVTPAIRPLWAVKPDEQKRIVTPTQAVQAGADDIVVGRPIANPPPGITCREAAKRIREELDKAAA